ncbi:murein hydrolase activator EnvC family protein [Salinithrix halophila]|uniref:Murein hydrolase activator EnvC family protein n=1 Tax=Salinithrix halophila TaxID=1485204 RepID=A0ABV8JHF2_9BACL
MIDNLVKPWEGRLTRTVTVAVIALSLMLSIWPVEQVQADKKDELKDKLDSIEKKKDEKEKNLKDLKEKVEDRKKKLRAIEEKLEDTRGKTKKVEKELKKAQKNVDKYGQQYKESVRNMYMTGQMNSFQSLLAADSFHEFLARFEYLRLIIKNDFRIVEKFYKEKEKVQKKRDKLAKLEKKQKKEEAKAKKAYDALVKEMGKNKSALASLDKEEALTKKDLAELNLEHLKAGNFAYQGPLTRPVNGPVTSGYGYRGSEFHTGIDYANSIGTPIHAPANGKVVRAQSCGCGYGYYIMIDHGGGVFTLFAHMWANQSRVSVGQVVRKGQQIAAVGNNGRSTGPHLHFEVHKGSPGNYTNPLNYMQ